MPRFPHSQLIGFALCGLLAAGCAGPGQSRWQNWGGAATSTPASRRTEYLATKPLPERNAPIVPPASQQPPQEPAVVRGQDPNYGGAAGPYGGNSFGPADTSGQQGQYGQQGTYNLGQPGNPGSFAPTQGNPSGGGFTGPTYNGGQPATIGANPYGGGLPAPPSDAYGGGAFGPGLDPNSQPQGGMTYEEAMSTPADLDVFVEETRTGRFMFGVAVNSDAGLSGNVTIDERNFDITRWPTSWGDFADGRAFRGRGQGFRIEAQPGNRLQRYLVSFTDPYLFETNVSFSASGSYFERNYNDYYERRLGGRTSLGYRLTPDLSLSLAARLENVNISNPRVPGVFQLDRALGSNAVYGIQPTLTHDTRDSPFSPTEGHLIQASFEQVLGDFQYSRGEVDWYQYFMLKERPDGSGRHTLAFTNRIALTGNDTPIYDRYFAGGYSTIRGYQFRGASPLDNTVRIGGDLRFLGSLEYFFPLTADDMVKGTVFCDYGTVEDQITINANNFRVAPGFGLRIAVPALGPAPLALDFAFPVASAAGDHKQTFSFFFGATRQ